MMTSLFSAAASLRAHQSELDVLGNNIANINTPGYKGEQAQFQELLVTTLKGGAAPKGNVGGRNPAQLGMGAGVVSVARNFTNGAVQSTGRPTDLALAGDGFFILSDGQQQFYTRDGSFTFDATGKLVNADGLMVQGWSGADGGPGAATGPLQVPVDEVLPASATQNLTLGGNLNAGAAVGTQSVTTMNVYDSLGQTQRVTVTFEKTAEGAWNWSAAGPDGASAGTGTLAFDGSGRLTAGDTGSLQIALSSGGATSPMAVQVSLAGITQVAGAGTPGLVAQDGAAPGKLRDVSVDSRGVITGLYTNGAQREFGRVALSRFVNPAGLNSLGSNLFGVSANSGLPQTAGAGDDASLKLTSGALEMSNVDLSREFTQMILAQRGFQANAKVITTTDEVLQELLTLKR